MDVIRLLCVLQVIRSSLVSNEQAVEDKLAERATLRDEKVSSTSPFLPSWPRSTLHTGDV